MNETQEIAVTANNRTDNTISEAIDREVTFFSLAVIFNNH